MYTPIENDWLLETLSSPINLFNNLQTFDEMVERGKRLGYQVIELDCRDFKSKDDIENAILHRSGSMEPEYFRTNMTSIVFEGMFRAPWRQEDCRALIAFRYFDYFQHIDPVCSQRLMNLMAEGNYRALWRGNRFFVCAHYEDMTMVSQLNLSWPSGWNTMPCFIEAADIEKQKTAEARDWIRQLEQAYKAQRQGDEGDADILGALMDMTGLRSVLEIWELGLSDKEVFRLANDQRQARVWWQDVGEQFVAGSGPSLTYKTAMGPFTRKFDSTSRTVLLREGISAEVAMRLMQEVLDEDAVDPSPPRRVLYPGWREKVIRLFNANSPTPQARYQVLHALYALAPGEGQFLSYRDATPEQAVGMLLNIEPEVWKSGAAKSIRARD